MTDASPSEIGIVVNGAGTVVEFGTSVSTLVAHLGLELSQIALERNLRILPKADWGGTILSEGDQIEIVHFVGGG
ncbi:MAG: sulfur carrier protein ThiS [Acidobacteriota bacterium]